MFNNIPDCNATLGLSVISSVSSWSSNKLPWSGMIRVSLTEEIVTEFTPVNKKGYKKNHMMIMDVKMFSSPPIAFGLI